MATRTRVHVSLPEKIGCENNVLTLGQVHVAVPYNSNYVSFSERQEVALLDSVILDGADKVNVRFE